MQVKLEQAFKMICNNENIRRFVELIKEIDVAHLSSHIVTLPQAQGRTTTLLGAAVAFSREEMIKKLLDRVDPNAKCENPPLCIAAMRLNVNLVKMFFNYKNVSPDIKDLHGYTPLHYFVSGFRPSIPANAELQKMAALAGIGFLLSQNADCNLQDNKGNTPLHIVVNLFNDKFIDLTLLNILAKVFLMNKNTRIDIRNRNELNVADMLVQINIEPIYQLIVGLIDSKNAADLNNALSLLKALSIVKHRTAIQENTINALITVLMKNVDYLNDKIALLLLLVDLGRFEQAEQLINSKMDNHSINQVIEVDGTHSGCSLLYLLVSRNNSQEIILALLKKGANPDKGLGLISPLIHALCTNNNDLAKLLLANGASANLSGSTDVLNSQEDTISPLQVAAQQGNLEMVRCLVEQYGVNVDTNTKKSTETPLIIAILSNRDDVVSYLLEKGADILHISNFGVSPFVAALKNNKFYIFDLLLTRLQLSVTPETVTNPCLSNLFVILADVRTPASFRDRLKEFCDACMQADKPFNVIRALRPNILLMACVSKTINPEMQIDFAWLYKISRLFFMQDALKQQMGDCLRQCYYYENKSLAKLLVDNYDAFAALDFSHSDNAPILDWLYASKIINKMVENNDAVEVSANTTMKLPTTALLTPPTNLPTAPPISPTQVMAAQSSAPEKYNSFTTDTITQKSISGRKFLLEKGFTKEEIAKLQHNTESNSPSKSLQKNSFFKTKVSKLLAELNWFDGQIKVSQVVKIENAEDKFLWIPNIFDPNIHSIFSSRRAKFDDQHIKLLTSLDHIQAIQLNGKDYSLKLYAEMKDINSEKRLLLYQHENLLIALHFLPKGLHTAADKQSLMSKTQKIVLPGKEDKAPERQQRIG